MGAYLNIFPYEYGTGSGSYENINITGDTPPSDDIFENVTGQKSMDVLGIFFGDISDSGGLLATIAIFGVAVIASFITKTAGPLVVAFLGNTIRVTYENSVTIINQYPIDPYITLAFGVGILFLIVIPSAEYLTHGDV